MAADYSDVNMYSFFPLFLQMKRKRIGAGLRGSSNPFLTAKDLLKQDSESNKGAESGGFYSDSSGGSGEPNTDASLAVTSSIRARANAVAASLNSPTKAGRALSKKQQKIAEAAKSSRNISQYFTKKQTTEKSQEDEEEVVTPKELDSTLSHTAVEVPQENSCQEEHSPFTEEAVEISPVESETQDVIHEESKEEAIVITDEDDNEEEETHKTETLELEWVQDTSKESTTE